MTDRYNALTVVLEDDIRDDDAKALLTAIRMLRGVLTVTPHVADHTKFVAETRAKDDLREKLFALIKGL